MILLDYAARIAVAWLVVATITVGAWHLAHARLKSRRDVGTRVALYPPPVPPSTTPPFTQTVASADWFWDVPSDCLSDDAIHSLCDDIERREFQ